MRPLAIRQCYFLNTETKSPERLGKGSTNNCVRKLKRIAIVLNLNRESGVLKFKEVLGLYEITDTSLYMFDINEIHKFQVEEDIGCIYYVV